LALQRITQRVNVDAVMPNLGQLLQRRFAVRRHHVADDTVVSESEQRLHWHRIDGVGRRQSPQVSRCRAGPVLRGGGRPQEPLGAGAYVQTAETYMRGLERRSAASLPLDVPSLASLFVSRWDAAADPRRS
jgi:hypothetical protein